MEDLLVKAGLNEAEAQTYIYLLSHGQSTPPTVAKALKLTRSNAYKVLDSLQSLGLASSAEVRKKLAYSPADPTALATLVATERNRVTALEQTVKEAMQQLQPVYRKSAGRSRVSTDHGQPSLIGAYELQAQQKQPIYFVRSRADVPFMGFDTMDRLRRLPTSLGTKRFGITPDSPEAPINPDIDKHSNLIRTWVPEESYTASVEWTASGDELLIAVFEDDGRLIRIQDAAVAHAFRQLWALIDSGARANPHYKPYGPRARREK